MTLTEQTRLLLASVRERIAEYEGAQSPPAYLLKLSFSLEEALLAMTRG